MFTMFRLIRSMDWPRVDCEIKKSCTVPSFKWDESDLAGTKLILEYQYKYNGINYSGNIIRFGLLSNRPRGLSRLTATRLAKKYHEGKITMASVNPKKPFQSILEPGEMGHMYFPLTISTILFLVSFYVFLN